MSLLKARRLEIKCEGYGALQQSFLEIIDSSDTYCNEDLIALVQIYTSYSVEYLIELAATLDKPVHVEDSMKLMNSYIAEICNETENKYYHKENGYTIIDKCIQEALDNDGTVSYSYVAELLEEINKSYEEPEIEEE